MALGTSWLKLHTLKVKQKKPPPPLFFRANTALSKHRNLGAAMPRFWNQ